MTQDTQATRFTLLTRIRDRTDVQAWSEFVDIYTPIVYGYLRRRGLQDADAGDVVQEVFRTVARSITSFQCDRQLGSFRGWLMTVTRSRLSDFLCLRRRQVSGTADTVIHRQIEEQAVDDSDAACWEQEYRTSLFEWAAEQIRGKFQEATWKAFWLTSVEGKSTKEVSASLGMTEGAIYIARCRVLAQLKKKIGEIEDHS